MAYIKIKKVNKNSIPQIVNQDTTNSQPIDIPQVKNWLTSCSSVDKLSADMLTKYRPIHGRVLVDISVNMLTVTRAMVSADTAGALSTHDPVWIGILGNKHIV